MINWHALKILSSVDVFLFLFFSCQTKSRFSDRISFMENNGLKNIPTVNVARKKMILQSGTRSDMLVVLMSFLCSQSSRCYIEAWSVKVRAYLGRKKKANKVCKRLSNARKRKMWTPEWNFNSTLFCSRGHFALQTELQRAESFTSDVN